MGEPDWCNVHHITYQSIPRTIVETILCLFIVAAYVPQYLAIVSQGTYGISSRYILFHSLFSILTLALRVSHPMFYDAFNCVDGGPYTGWKAYSALLGFIQAIVQFVAAMILLGLYIGYRTDERQFPDQSAPGIPSRTLQAAVGTVAMAVLSVSIALLWFNQNEAFDQDDPTKMSNILFVYNLGFGIWAMLLIPADIACFVLQFVYQIKAVRALHSHGALSLVSAPMQAAAFVLLAAAQALRDWEYIHWIKPGDFWPVWRFLDCFAVLYGSIDTHVAYFCTGIGFFALFVVCLVEGRSDPTGGIRL